MIEITKKNENRTYSEVYSKLAYVIDLTEEIRFIDSFPVSITVLSINSITYKLKKKLYKAVIYMLKYL